MFHLPIKRFKTQKNIEIKIYKPNINLAENLLAFINRLVEEDTYLVLTEKNQTLESQLNYIKANLTSIKNKDGYVLWAMAGQRIVAIVSLIRCQYRSLHVGKISIMVDRDFREQGVGSYLLGNILDRAKNMGFKIVILDCFSDNIAALQLYKKYGFIEYGRLPNGLFRKNQFSDDVYMYKNIS